jgi:hypothetical protein
VFLSQPKVMVLGKRISPHNQGIVRRAVMRVEEEFTGNKELS